MIHYKIHELSHCTPPSPIDGNRMSGIFAIFYFLYTFFKPEIETEIEIVSLVSSVLDQSSVSPGTLLGVLLAGTADFR
jgi:hypothetical protein